MSLINEKENVMKGAEEYFHKGSDIGVLVIHGFTGTPQSVRYLAEQIAKQGYTVLVPILSGHGTAVEELETFTYHDWIRDVETGWERLKGMCNKIFVIGFSMGEHYHYI